jgi:hypothetical protein
VPPGRVNPGLPDTVVLGLNFLRLGRSVLERCAEVGEEMPSAPLPLASRRATGRNAMHVDGTQRMIAAFSARNDHAGRIGSVAITSS